MWLPQHIVLFNNARRSPLRRYRTSPEMRADDSFDLVKSDSASGPYLAPVFTVRLHFNSSGCLFLCLPSSNFLLCLPYAPLFSGYLFIPVFLPHMRICLRWALYLYLPPRLLWQRVKGVWVREHRPTTVILSTLFLCIHGEWSHKLMKRWMDGDQPSATGRHSFIIYALFFYSCKSLHLIFAHGLGSLFQITRRFLHKAKIVKSREASFTYLVGFFGHGNISFTFSLSSTLISEILYLFCCWCLLGSFLGVIFKSFRKRLMLEFWKPCVKYEYCQTQLHSGKMSSGWYVI